MGASIGISGRYRGIDVSELLWSIIALPSFYSRTGLPDCACSRMVCYASCLTRIHRIVTLHSSLLSYGCLVRQFHYAAEALGAGSDIWGALQRKSAGMRQSIGMPIHSVPTHGAFLTNHQSILQMSGTLSYISASAID